MNTPSLPALARLVPARYGLPAHGNSLETYAGGGATPQVGGIPTPPPPPLSMPSLRAVRRVPRPVSPVSVTLFPSPHPSLYIGVGWRGVEIPGTRPAPAAREGYAPLGTLLQLVSAHIQSETMDPSLAIVSDYGHACGVGIPSSSSACLAPEWHDQACRMSSFVILIVTCLVISPDRRYPGADRR